MAWIRSHLYLPVLALVAAYVHASVVPFRAHLSSGKVLLVLGILVSIAGMCRHHLIGVQKAALNVNVAISKITSGQPRDFRRLVADFTDTASPGRRDRRRDGAVPTRSAGALGEDQGAARRRRQALPPHRRADDADPQLQAVACAPPTADDRAVRRARLPRVGRARRHEPVQQRQAQEFVASRVVRRVPLEGVRGVGRVGDGARPDLDDHGRAAARDARPEPAARRSGPGRGQQPEPRQGREPRRPLQGHRQGVHHLPLPCRRAARRQQRRAVPARRRRHRRREGARAPRSRAAATRCRPTASAARRATAPASRRPSSRPRSVPSTTRRRPAERFGTVFAPLFENPNPLPQRIHDIGNGDNNFWNDPIQVEPDLRRLPQREGRPPRRRSRQRSERRPHRPERRRDQLQRRRPRARFRSPIPRPPPTTTRTRTSQLDENEVDAKKDVVLQTTYDEWQDYVAFFDAPERLQGSLQLRQPRPTSPTRSTRRWAASECHMPLEGKDHPNQASSTTHRACCRSRTASTTRTRSSASTTT